MNKLYSKVTPFIKRNMVLSDAIKKQFCLDEKEYIISGEEEQDPIGDERYTKCNGVIHRYNDRALFIPRKDCLVQCRFCFRKWKLPEKEAELTFEEIDVAINYFREHKELWEVILTGGEPLLTSKTKLKYILEKIHEIPHIKVIRIHTRAIIVQPDFIDEEMIKIISKYKPIYLVIHCNHYDEITEEVSLKLNELSDNGIVLLSQSALLKGINDDSKTLEKLFKKLIENRVKPYYLHHCDLVPGTYHFRTSIKEGQEILKKIRGHVSGICWPTYVLDIPKGFGKVPLGPIYYKKDEKGNTIITDYKGNDHKYPDTDNRK
ncbi:KamA family radical SAM protein [Fusobacterium sp. SYSU M8D902]|uniref:KamA family radical SAM protein n=1 Tax=Fusobacterium sp. SYSU M8D902 TaxID=3159562 RepID=UPI0032E52A52